jgi:hypothetical protein
MRPRSPAVRTVRHLLAALQLLLPGAAAWADARLDAAGAHATAHVESHSTDSCARIHASDCALCHFLTTPLASRRPPTHRHEGASTELAPTVAPATPGLTLAHPHPQPRAPPRLS